MTQHLGVNFTRMALICTDMEQAFENRKRVQHYERNLRERGLTSN